MIYTQPNRYFTSSKPKPSQLREGRLLGRELREGIYEGVGDSTQLLQGQYDDSDTTVVDPLCQLGGERFENNIVHNSTPVSQSVETSADVPSDPPSVPTTQADE